MKYMIAPKTSKPTMALGMGRMIFMSDVAHALSNLSEKEAAGFAKMVEKYIRVLYGEKDIVFFGIFEGCGAFCSPDIKPKVDFLELREAMRAYEHFFGEIASWDTMMYLDGGGHVLLSTYETIED